MRPFSISEASKKLIHPYPPPDVLRDLAAEMSLVEKLGFIRLWVSEGIPFAFQGLPILYEALRTWVGNELSVHPKTVTVVGSGRIGYSLSPAPHFGRQFSAASDLDLVVVDVLLFDSLRGDFEVWKDDLLRGRIVPRNLGQQKYWPQNIRELPATLQRGFIDANRIPYLLQYRTAQTVGDAMSRLTSKLDATALSPKVRRASLRVYKDWQAFVAQLFLSFQRALNSLVPSSAPSR